MSAKKEDIDMDAVQALAAIFNNPNNNKCPSSTSKASEKEPSPRKKPTATTAEKSKEDTNIPWKTNYKIVEVACRVLESMATKERGNNERLGWTQLVGNEAHKCPYLPKKKKMPLYRIVSLVAEDDKYETMDQVVLRVHQFLRNTKYLDKKKMPGWKRDLLDKLKLDIQK